MRTKLLMKSLLVAAGLFVGASAWAEEAALNPVGVFTWTNAPAITYDGAATSWIINQGGVSDGKIGRYAGPYAIVKFDASAVLTEKTLLTATLDFDVTAGTYNSSINIAQMSDASFDPATVTTETFDASATQFQAGDWSTKNATVHFSYDVKDRVAASNVLAFAIYTNTGREQTLKNLKLNLQYATGEVAKYSYSLKAVDESDAEIKTLASGEEYETNSVTAYFPYMFNNEGKLYTTAKTPYCVTFDKDNTSEKVTYSVASSAIVAYMEGEASSANSGENEAYSNGKHGYAAGNKTQTIATLPAGKYTATIKLVSNPNRSIVIRNTANSDVATNVIVSLPISKTSAAGVYTSDEFVLSEETTIGFSGYTSGTKTNQSADIDYIYITKTGEATVSATIGATGYTTFASTEALDLSKLPAGLTAYYASAVGAEDVTFTSLDVAVPAGTGLLLKGTASTAYNIPVAATASALEGNKLVGCTAETALTANANYWVLVNNAGAAEFQSLKTNGATIPAGKAYLNAAAAGSRLAIVFNDETTGIATVENASVLNENYYNLNGQRIVAPQKGLYIVNGKKVVLK